MPLNEKQFDFYFEEVCPHGDEVFRLSYLLLLNKQAAWKCVSKTFDSLLERLPTLEENMVFHLLSSCWKTFREQEYRPEIDDSPLSQSFSKLSVEERSAMAFVDLFGFQSGDAAKALERTEEQLRMDLSQARQKLLRVDFA